MGGMRVYNHGCGLPPGKKYKIEDDVFEKRGISTCCAMCGASFVDIARVSKERNSEKLRIEFTCNSCYYINEHISHLLIK